MNESFLFDRSDFFALIGASGHPALQQWSERLREICDQRLVANNDALFGSWKSVLDRLPALSQGSLDASGDVIRVVGQCESSDPFGSLHADLRQLNPWRIGPYRLCGVDVDAEWRSNMKWDRIASEIYLDGAKVLDVGCNNGYFGFKALAAGAQWVMGVEPFLLYIVQHEIFRGYLTNPASIGVMPIKAAEIPSDLRVFDVALSMGVLYHRKDPIGHLDTLHDSLRKRGQLILETMAIDSEKADVIVPKHKFAKMRGVWFMPTVGMLKRWLRRTGFVDVKVIDVSVTDQQEQRKTDFMPFESLSDFLDPNDPGRTIEGYPTPVRVAISGLRAN
ncbi:tRNA 5-methoxyuridine(34)/uridine 5-oxyacetic acid(34) synthase CmoB [bacterium]|nr:tRNA 5-methoxyuridine(34)/uridine 5-oxyacetic acid(34) synthase CmoB [bacterium]